jgi:hypothetical protein
LVDDESSDWRDHAQPAITGLWYFQYLSKGNKALDIPDGAILDQGNTIWFADGNEKVKLKGREELLPVSAAYAPCSSSGEQSARRAPPLRQPPPRRPPLWRLVQLDLDVDARGKLELHQGVDGLVRRIQDVHEALVRADLELIARILVPVRRYQDGESLHFDGQRHRTLDGRAGALRGVDDLARGLVDQAMIEGLQANADVLISHK